MSRRTRDTSVEDRLRATLTAEAERHPVHPDLDALRTRSDAAVAEVRRRPDRARILTAAAILIVVAVGALVVLRASGEVSDDDGQAVASGAGTSGYHLPGPGWSVVGVEVSGALSSGWTREVLFARPTAMEDDSTTRILVDVVPVTSLTGATERWEEAGATQLDRSADGPPIWTVALPVEDASPGPALRLLMPGDGEVLVLSSTGVPLEALVDLADRWRDSDGREIALDAGSGLERWSDQTRPEANPVDPGPLAGGEAETGQTLEPLVLVTAESSEGVRAAYLLAATGTRGRPTGVGDADGGIARGIEPEAGPQPVDGLRNDGEVWRVPGPQGPDALLALLPGVDIFVSNGPEPASEPADEDDLHDLMAGLRPVDGATWSSVVGAFPAGVEWTDRLADLGLPDRLADPDRDDPSPSPTPDPSITPPVVEPTDQQIRDRLVTSPWVLDSVTRGQPGTSNPVPADTGVRLTFHGDETYTFESTCDGGTGNYAVEGGAISLTSPSITALACDKTLTPGDEAGLAFSQALRSTTIGALDGSQLIITSNETRYSLTTR